jgi:hypothetical protein
MSPIRSCQPATMHGGRTSPPGPDVERPPRLAILQRSRYVPDQRDDVKLFLPIWFVHEWLAQTGALVSPAFGSHAAMQHPQAAEP